VSGRRAAALVGLAFVAACGGTEELALNPVSTTSLGGAGDTAMMPTGGGGAGISGVGATAGAASGFGQAGTVLQAGQGPSSCSVDVECAAPTPRCSENGSCVACLSDDECPLDGARHCNEQGRCVACVEAENCGDGEVCDPLTGTCQTCATGDCAGSAGASSEDAKP